MQSISEKLVEYRSRAELGGGEAKIANQHEKGKLTARERIALLFDPGTFVETDAFVIHDCHDFGADQNKILGDGVITGFGEVDSRLVYAFAQDFTVFGGSLSHAHAQKICKIMDLAVQNGAPIIGINDSGGARIHEGVASLGGYADVFYRNVKASGIVPQLSLIMGPCAGGAVYSPAITDFIFMVEQTSHMFITGPSVIKAVTGEDIDFERLGGSQTHSSQSGVSDLAFANEADAIEAAKKWLSYIPSSNRVKAHKVIAPEALPAMQEKLRAQKEKIQKIVPENPNLPYNMTELVNCVVDPDSFFEIKPDYASNIVVGFARLAGISIGIVANNPKNIAGVLDINASVKAARFIRFCNAFSLPLLTFVDVPGFLPGSEQERGGIIRHGAKLLYAYCEANVPKLTLIVRKAYGGAYDVMSSKHIGGDFNLAWPQAEIAVMGASGACNIIFRKEIESSQDPEKERAERIQSYCEKFANPYIAASKGYIDAVIFPSETRECLIRGLKASLGKTKIESAKKHGNIPL